MEHNCITVTPDDDVLVVNLKTFEMQCYKGGESFHIKLLSGNQYYYERKCIATGEILDADITDIETLRNGGNIPGVVHWMARGYRGLPTDHLTEEMKRALQL